MKHDECVKQVASTHVAELPTTLPVMSAQIPPHGVLVYFFLGLSHPTPHVRHSVDTYLIFSYLSQKPHFCNSASTK